MSRLLLFITIVLSAGICQAEEFLTADQIKQLVSGKTVTAKHLKRDVDLVTFFSSDGQVFGLANGNKRKGKWWTDEKNQQCIKWDHKEKTFCRGIKAMGDGTYQKIKFKKKRKKKIPVVQWLKFEEGNKIN